VFEIWRYLQYVYFRLRKAYSLCKNLLKYGSKVRDIRVSLVVVGGRVDSGLGSVVAVACRFLSTGSAHSVDALIN